jgi:RimJ/RimL family protein N-acetyltransferase
MMDLWSTISSERLSLVAMTPDLLAMMSGEVAAERPFEWPKGRPDDTDRAHIATWQDRAAQTDANVAWGPRALVGAHRQMVGHAGFHLPPRPLEVALGDATFVGTLDPTAGGVVEVGYTIFPNCRHQGYATEAVTALVGWAETTGEVTAVVASIAEHNDASVRVLERVGGFVIIGACRTSDGVAEVVFRRELGCARRVSAGD